MVLLHGIGSNAQSFEPLMGALDGKYPTLAWDAPGYGESKPLAMQWPDASDYAEALGRLLAQLQITRCVVVGHSLGCLIAARYAVMAKAKVAALILVSPARGYRSRKGDPLPAPVARRIEELDQLGAEKFAAKRAPSLLADASDRPDVLQAVARAMAGVHRPGYDQACRMLASGRLHDDAVQVEVPAAIINGDKDSVTPVANGQLAYQDLQKSSPRHLFQIIDGAGHAICQEKPEEVARVLVEFLEDIHRAITPAPTPSPSPQPPRDAGVAGAPAGGGEHSQAWDAGGGPNRSLA
jgi:pimeloyl-ACP methyl ester carboxylesterase